MQPQAASREITIYVCSLCKEPFETTSSLIGHMIAIHTNNLAIDALLRKVSQKFQRKASYVTKNQKGNRRFHKCTKCPFRVKYIETILRHIEKHNEYVTTYSCPICPFKTIQPMNLKCHMKKRHKERIMVEPPGPKMKTVKKEKIKKKSRR